MRYHISLINPARYFKNFNSQHEGECEETCEDTRAHIGGTATHIQHKQNQNLSILELLLSGLQY